MPKISICCPSYNHEKYVPFFINSVLKQTEQDFELLITDDFSSDNTVREIQAFSDPRIKFCKNPYNQGINSVLTSLIGRAKAPVICFVASDDMLRPDYLDKVLNVFTRQPEVSLAYVSLQCIDEQNRPLPRTVRVNAAWDKYGLLRQLFLGENILPSPGMAFRKEIILPFLPLPAGVLQYQDWQLHCKLLLAGNQVAFLDEPLVEYRVSGNSASARNEGTVLRESLETSALMDSFLQLTDVALFKRIFDGEYAELGEPVRETLPYFIGRMALKSSNPDKRKWGYGAVMNFISVPSNQELLYRLYQLQFKDLTALVSFCRDSSKADNCKILAKAKKYKKLSCWLGVLLLAAVLWICRGCFL